MNTARLAQALIHLAITLGAEITAIQFEDGSGNKFNYTRADETGWKYIDLTGEI